METKEEKARERKEEMEMTGDKARERKEEMV